LWGLVGIEVPGFVLAARLRGWLAVLEGVWPARGHRAETNANFEIRLVVGSSSSAFANAITEAVDLAIAEHRQEFPAPIAEPVRRGCCGDIPDDYDALPQPAEPG